MRAVHTTTPAVRLKLPTLLFHGAAVAPSARGGGRRGRHQQQESSDDEDRLHIDEEDLIEDEEDRKRWVLCGGPRHARQAQHARLGRFMHCPAVIAQQRACNAMVLAMHAV